MARINGVNSDYKWQGDGVVELVGFPLPQNPPDLEMKLFICPYGKDSSLQSDGAVCEGTDTTCPNATKTGHAMIQLSQNDGISLKTDAGTELNLRQNTGQDAGNILMNPAGGTVKLAGEIEIVSNGHTIKITPSATGISMKHTNGAEVVFKPNGDLDLITKNNTGTVNIQGNLVVSGTLSRQGQVI